MVSSSCCCCCGCSATASTAAALARGRDAQHRAAALNCDLLLREEPLLLLALHLRAGERAGDANAARGPASTEAVWTLHARLSNPTSDLLLLAMLLHCPSSDSIAGEAQATQARQTPLPGKPLPGEEVVD